MKNINLSNYQSIKFRDGSYNIYRLYIWLWKNEKGFKFFRKWISWLNHILSFKGLCLSQTWCIHFESGFTFSLFQPWPENLSIQHQSWSAIFQTKMPPPKPEYRVILQSVDANSHSFITPTPPICDTSPLSYQSCWQTPYCVKVNISVIWSDTQTRAQTNHVSLPVTRTTACLPITSTITRVNQWTLESVKVRFQLVTSVCLFVCMFVCYANPWALTFDVTSS